MDTKREEYKHILEEVAKLIGRHTYDNQGCGFKGFFIGSDDWPFLTFNDEPDGIFGYCYTDKDGMCDQQGKITDMFPNQIITPEIMEKYIRDMCKKHNIEVK